MASLSEAEGEGGPRPATTRPADDLKSVEAENGKPDPEHQDRRHSWLTSPLTALVVTGGLGLAAAVTTNFIQGANAIQLEREKLVGNLALQREGMKADLILKVIDTGDAKASARNLLFLLDAGLIDDPTKSIEKLRTDPESAPVLGGPRDTVVPATPGAVGAFFELYRAAFPTARPDALANLEVLIRFIAADQAVQDIRATAYILALIDHETASTFAAMTEYGSEEWLEESYGPTSQLGLGLGNTEPGDGARYRGRGYVMLTGKANYERVGRAIGHDLVADPDLALDPAIAYQILSLGLAEGTFTGKRLSQYINAEGADYRGARRVLNGLDQADRIASRAVLFEDILRRSIPHQN